MLKNIKHSFMYDVYVKRNIFILQLLISSKLHYKIIIIIIKIIQSIMT